MSPQISDSSNVQNSPPNNPDPNVPPVLSTPVQITVSTTRRREAPTDGCASSNGEEASDVLHSRKKRKYEDGPTRNALYENVSSLTNNAFQEPQEFIHVIAEYIERYTSQDEWVPPSTSELSAFFGISIPDMRPKDYVARIFVYAYCSPSAFIIALILIKRAANKHMELCWTVCNIHRLLLSGIIVATKIVDDRLFTMAHYSRVGGVPTTKETLRLEVIFLKSIHNDIGVSEKCFAGMMKSLVEVRDELRARRNPPLHVTTQTTKAELSTAESTSQGDRDGELTQGVMVTSGSDNNHKMTDISATSDDATGALGGSPSGDEVMESNMKGRIQRGMSSG